MSYALLCPGQGAQAPGLLGAVLEQSPELVSALCGHLQMPVESLRTLSADALRRNAIAQPCIMAAQLAHWHRLATLVPPPALAMGYSLGEVTAFVIAAGCAPAEALALAQARANAMDQACARPCAMLALRGLGQSAVETLCAGVGWHIAIRNGEDRFVVAGEREQTEALAVAAQQAGAGVNAVNVTTPSHTPLLARAVAPFHTALERLCADGMDFPLISATDASLVRRAAPARRRLADQLAAPLDWAGAMDALVERGIDTCLELGPGADLSRMLRERHPQISARSVAEFSSLENAAQWVRQALALPM